MPKCESVSEIFGGPSSSFDFGDSFSTRNDRNRLVAALQMHQTY